MPSDILPPLASDASAVSGFSRAWRGVRSVLTLPGGGMTGVSWNPRSAVAWADKSARKRRFLEFASYKFSDDDDWHMTGFFMLRVVPFSLIGLTAFYSGFFTLDAAGLFARTEQEMMIIFPVRPRSLFNLDVMLFLLSVMTPMFAIMGVMRANFALHGPLRKITRASAKPRFSEEMTNPVDLANGNRIMDALHGSQWNATFVARVAAELGPQDARDITLLLAFPEDPSAPQGGEASELLSRVAEWVRNTENAAA